MMTSMIFMMIKHPLSMMITLILYTMNICMIIGMINKTFWFSYILFLIMLGGMMILFMYMTNLTSNKILKFNLLKFMLIMVFLLMMYFTLLYLFNDMLIMYLNMNNKEMIISNMNIMKNIESSMHVNKIFNTNYNYISLLLMTYLFINLIAIVKIINIKSGPLRIKNN
uniref:NADH-ubiquinone oxidoreductase chain 6 n=1 Tax=Cephalcia yanqingensis TaxID=2853409 RepID=A0A8H2SJ43_9HYME|nr:NADH dehydrogenase subunit 6 [Cephalcia yanqingensis]